MLVSIVVVTYNSARFVEETLDSILVQDYEGELELIVSDDCSQDDTLSKVQRWIEYNRDRFFSSRVIKTPKNGGICANYNFALHHVTGEWVKYIAGDDKLMPDCISKFVAATCNSNDKFFVCGVIPFESNGNLWSPRLSCEKYLDGTAFEQKQALFEHGLIIEGPTLFLETHTLRKMGGGRRTLSNGGGLALGYEICVERIAYRGCE